eukprot:765489-Hanusia_phi.AAC.5
MDGSVLPPQKFVRNRSKSRDESSQWKEPNFPLVNGDSDTTAEGPGAVLLEARWTDFMLFQHLSPVNLNKCISVMKPKIFEANSTILQKGTLGDCLYFLDVGVAGAVIDDKVIEVLGSGDFFGEIAFISALKILLKNPKATLQDFPQLQRVCDVRAKKECRCLELNVNDFLDVLKGDLPGNREVLRVLRDFADERFVRAKKTVAQNGGLKPRRASVLEVHQIQWRDLELFQMLSEEDFNFCMSKMKKREYRKGDKIVEKGTVGTSMFFLDAGTVNANLDGRVLEDLKSGDIFGEISFIAAVKCLLKNSNARLKDHEEVQRVCDVDASSDCSVLVFSVYDFLSMLKSNVQRHRDVLKFLKGYAERRKAKVDKTTIHHCLPPSEDFESATCYSFSPEANRWNKYFVYVKIAEKPFAEGTFRACFKIEVFHNSSTVLKVAKTWKVKAVPNQYFQEVINQALAQQYANEFNTHDCVKSKICFLPMEVLRLHERENQLVTIEPLLEGKYVKHNDNYGEVGTEDDIPQAFSHFTWDASSNRILICDIQGVDMYWTDPQIHSIDPSQEEIFGKGNFGLDGVKQFFHTHRCNSLCIKLGLSSNPRQKPAGLHRSHSMSVMARSSSSESGEGLLGKSWRENSFKSGLKNFKAMSMSFRE